MAPTFKNRQSLSVKLNAIGQNTGREVGRAVLRAGQRIADTAAAKITNPPKSGRVYRKGTPREHQASAPGEAPARDSGRLSQSLTVVPTVSGPDRYVAETGANTPYALRLELGGYSVAKNQHGTAKRGPSRVYIAPRPFMGPSFDETRERNIEDIKAAVVRGAKGGK